MKVRTPKWCAVFLFVGLIAAISVPTSAATITVLNAEDNGAGSLRQALADAGPGDTINFDSSLSGSNIVLSAGELLVTNSLIITGLGADQLTVDGNFSSRVFHISGNVVVIISGLKITGGTATGANGGGILNDAPSSLTLIACVISGNSAPSGGSGGGIYNTGGLTLNECTVAINTATYRGGGLVNLGTATLTNCLVKANTAIDSGGGIYNLATLTAIGGTRITANVATYYGCGILSTNGLCLIDHCVIDGNNGSGAGGGALFNDDGSTATISQSIITNNVCGYAGGFFNSGRMFINASTVAGNAATSQNGGGVFNSNNGNLLIVISTLANNSAARSGGGIVNYGLLRLAESTLAGNNAATNGGNIALFLGGLVIDNTILANSPVVGNSTNNPAVTVTSLGHNLSDDNSAATLLTSPTDENNTPASLDLNGLQNNGGPTPTLALANGSAAIMAGGPVYSPFTSAIGGGEPIYPPFTDQRGLPRFDCGKMDIGAFQTQDTPPPVIALIGNAIVTNECPAVFIDPGATASDDCASALNIAANGNHSLGLRIDGTVATWGDNANGLNNPPGNLGQVSAVAAGAFHSLALQISGSVVAWGNNADGQTNVPASVTNAIAISGGGLHSLALLHGGSVVAWGFDTSGQTNVPASVTNAVAIAAGGTHSLALISDGTVVGWGDDSDGQTNVPASVTNALAVAAGGSHSLALLNDGSVVGWGADTTGQTNVPANVTNATAIAAGLAHSLALLRSGQVVAWGDNSAGQTNVPASLNNAVAIAAGYSHSLAITRDGAVVGWGLNSNGQTVATADLRAVDLTGSITTGTVGSTSGLGSYTRTYTVVDAHNSTSSVSRTVTTVDTTPPVPDVTPLPSITNACSVTLIATSATDACAGSITGTTTDPLTYNLPGTFLVTWSYNDGNGNISTQTQSVVINRASPPAIVCPSNIVASNVLNQCGATVSYSTPVVTPDCASATTTRTMGLASGTFFPVGVTTNAFQVIDASNKTNTCSFTVTVLDTQAPTISCPANIVTATDAGQCTKSNVTFTANANDNCPGVSYVCVPASGSTFAKGTNNVTCTATDSSGNTANCSFSVTVNDTQNPTISCPANIVTATDAGQCTKSNVTFTATVNDNCPGVSYVCVPASGSTFAKGTNNVTCTATDSSGNTANCSFSVTVNDTENPTISCPANIVTATDAGQCTKSNVTFTATVNDNCPGVSYVCVPASGSTFAKGTNNVTCTATDSSGNTANCSFSVTVNDTQNPTISCPANIVTATDAGQCTKSNVTFTATVNDNCPGVSYVCVPASGSTFAKGTNNVTCTATDSSGNTANCSFSVTVNDTENPTISCPGNIVTATDVGQCTKSNVTFTATANDNCPGVSYVCVPASGSTFAKGTNNVTCTATDSSGNTANCSFSVTVNDTQNPTISCPANIVTATDAGQCTKSNVTFTATANDNCPGVSYVCVPASGSTFAKGTNSVTCTATDAAGNTANCSFSVTVNDTENPTISCPGNIVTATDVGQCTKSNVTFTATVNDNCPGVSYVCVPASGSTFAKGTNNVTCTATDGSGNTANCSFTVTVLDTQPPTISCPANILTATDAGQCTKSNVTFAATANDNCPGVSYVCVPASGSTFAKGTNNVTCTATDAVGNTANCSFSVTVTDTENPTISCPANIVIATDADQCTRSNVTFAPTANDNCPGVSYVCVPASGSTFAKGTNNVTCTATDAVGNTANCSFSVIVVDQQAPTIGCLPSIVTNTAGALGTVVTFAAPTASDNCPGVTVTYAPGSPVSGDTFPVGTSNVVFVATDAAGNQSTCTFSVTVLGPRTQLQGIRDDILALRGQTSDTADLKKLDLVITKLSQMDALWTDEGHVDPKKGGKFYSLTKFNLKTLQKLIVNPKSTLPGATLQDFLARINGATRLVTVILIDDATAANGNATYLAKARSALAAGDTAAGTGDYVGANQYYKIARRAAANALKKHG